MIAPQHLCITVGVDDSPAALRAVRWAARQAVAHGMRLHLIYVSTWPEGMSIPIEDTGWDSEASRAAGEDIIAQAVLTARDAAPGAQISSELAEGLPSLTLIERSADSWLTVVGHHAATAAGDLTMGSIASQLVMYGHSSVAVLPESMFRPAEDGPGVVLGADIGEHGQAAIGWAFDEASRHRLPLTAVRAWTLASRRPGIRSSWPDAGTMDIEQRRLLSECLAGWRSKYPEVEVREQLIRERAAHALCHISRDADLLVVGARGAGGFPGLLLGGVADAVVRRATCPVVVAR
jgi:nucleotide-binding universal stress UspA family protein